jgi:hypothetical protein
VLDSGVDDGSPLVIEGSSWGAGIKFFCVSTVGIVCADRSLLLGPQKSGVAQIPQTRHRAGPGL